MGVNIDVGGIGRDQQGIIAGGDVKNARLINTGDVSGSYNAIGDGSRVIVNNTQSRVQELKEEAQEADRRLSLAIEAYVRQLNVALRAPAVTDKSNPYKSLLSYELEDAPFFYGRDEAIDDLLDIIHYNRLAILHADSGSGKSSLLKAGIASRLLAAGHLPLHVRPYDRLPAQAIKQELLSDVENLPELARLNQMSLPGFLKRVDECLGPSTLYIFLDQFEEFFDELRPDAQKAFAAELAACLKQPGPDVRWVLSLRKEAFSDLNVFRPYIPAPYENDYFLKAFDAKEANDVIVEPVRRQGVAYENGLVEMILGDLQPQQGDWQVTAELLPIDEEQREARLAPPQVQLVCYTLFEEWRATWRKNGVRPLITKDLYQKPRGILQQTGAKGILNGHLSMVLDRMDVMERKSARQILEALVTSRATRVIVGKADLVAELQKVKRDADEHLVQDLLNRLVDDRLISEIDRQGTTSYELAHDYLLSQIELDPATQARKAAQEMLNQEVAAWENNQKLRIPADKLDIIEAQEGRLVFSSGAKELLKLSREALQRQKRLVFTGGGIVALMIIAAIISVITAVGARGTASAAQGDATAAAYALATAETQQAAAETAVAEAIIAQNAIQEAGTAVAATATAAAYALQAEVILTYDNYLNDEGIPPRPLFAESAKLEIAMSPSSAANKSLQRWSNGLLLEYPAVHLTSNVQNVDQQVLATVDGTTIQQVNTFTDFVGELGEYANPVLWTDVTIEAILSATSPNQLPQAVGRNLIVPLDTETFDKFYGIAPATREFWGESDYGVSPVMRAKLDIYVAGQKVASLDGMVASVWEWDEDVRGLYVIRFLIKE